MFRILQDKQQKPILSNRHSLQHTDHRKVYHVCPSGFTYITILPIRLVDLCDKIDKIDADNGEQRNNDR